MQHCYVYYSLERKALTLELRPLLVVLPPPTKTLNNNYTLYNIIAHSIKCIISKLDTSYIEIIHCKSYTLHNLIVNSIKCIMHYKS